MLSNSPKTPPPPPPQNLKENKKNPLGDEVSYCNENICRPSQSINIQ